MKTAGKLVAFIALSGANIPQIIALLFLLTFPFAARAQGPVCNEGNEVKFLMSPSLYGGLGVQDSQGIVLADDFFCNQTGPINDIHIWGCWSNDRVASTPPPFWLGIYDNVPAANGVPSHPGTNLLWSDFFPIFRLGVPSYCTSNYSSAGNECFYSPTNSNVVGNSTNIYYYTFSVGGGPGIAGTNQNPFIQQGTPANPTNYWLAVSALVGDTSTFGWNTSSSNYGGSAVWIPASNGVPATGLAWNSLSNLVCLSSNQAQVHLAFKIANFAAVCTTAPADMVAWWPGGNNANDLVGTNNGTLTNGASFAAGKVGYGFSFDGVAAYVDFGAGVGDFGTNDFTAEFWMKTTSSNIEYLLGKRPGCGHASFWDIRHLGSGVLEAEVDQDSNGLNYTDAVGTHTINDGLFHHVAMVRQGANLSVYVDGGLDATATGPGVAFVANSGSLTAGKTGCTGYNPGLDYFNGVLDEISLYSRALSAAEVQAIYLAGSAGKCVTSPYVTSVGTSGGNFSLSWLAQRGLTYQVQYKSDLNPASLWNDLSGTVTATGAIASKTDTLLSNAPQRFYRVIMFR